VQQNSWPFWLAWILSFATIIAMGCSQTLRRVHPWNYVSFGVFTATFAFLVGTVTSFYDISVLALALGITSGVVGFVWILATTSGFDFTRKGARPFGGFVCCLLGAACSAGCSMWRRALAQRAWSMLKHCSC
jgi:FtsH-binding integral membrane protein